MKLSATELSRTLGVSKGRVSQYVASGQLDGCYEGSGRARRFDVAKVAHALGRRLDGAQMMGNGAQTQRRISELARVAGPGAEVATGGATGGIAAPVEPKRAEALRDGSELPVSDLDRLQMERAQANADQARENARRLRRENAQAEGLFVLRSEVEREVQRQIAQEVAEVDAVLRTAARRVADRMGVDYRQVRQILQDSWREHRTGRAEALEADLGAASLSDAEREADF